MVNSKIHNDDTISVVPRIIDPNMKFTKESLDMIESKKNKNIEFNILENNISKNQTTESEKIIENPTISVGFFSKYKYYILIIIIIILICIIIYFIYKYYSKKDCDTETFNKPQSNDKLNSNETIEKKKEINKYLSNYIVDDNDDIDETNNQVLNNQVLNNQVLNNQVLNNQVLNNQVLNNQVLNNQLSNNKINSINIVKKENINTDIKENNDVFDIGGNSENNSFTDSNSNISSNDINFIDEFINNDNENDNENDNKTDNNNNNNNNNKNNDIEKLENLEKNDLDYFKKFINTK